MNRTALLFCAVGLLSAPAAAQDRVDSRDLKRYALELKPGGAVDARLETIRNVAYYQQKKTTEVLVVALQKTLQDLERLETERKENEETIRRMIEPQILAADGPDALINYAGLEQFQELQKTLGAQITAEEEIVRALRDAIAGSKDADVIAWLLKYKAKKPARLKLTLLDAFGKIDDGRVTEKLIEGLSDKDLDVQLTSAEALSHHAHERVPVAAWAALLESPQWQARMRAVEALSTRGGAEALGLLIHQTPRETGRQLSDLVARLEAMTGQKFGRSPRAWMAWWSDHKETLSGAAIVLDREITPKQDGPVEYWGMKIDSLRVIFIIDISGTMQAALDDHENLFPDPGKSRLDLARREIKAAIGGLPSDAAFNLIAYNDIVMSWEELSQMATPSNKKKSYEWLDKLVAVSQTNIFDALEMGFQMARPGNRDKHYERRGDTVLFLSDGGPTAGRTTDCDEILEQVQDWNRTANLTIHTIGIGRQLNRQFMQALAKQNNGKCQFIE